MNSIPRKYLLIYGPSVTIVLISAVLASEYFVSLSPELAAGIIYDLVIISPVIYLAIIWKSDIPKISALPLFILGLMLAGILIPESYHFHLDLLTTYLLPLVELGIIGLVIIGTRKIIRSYRQQEAHQTDFLDAMNSVLIKHLGKTRLTNVLATEMAMFYYAFFQWKGRKLKESEFTSYHRSGMSGILIAIILIVLVETVIVHLVVIRYNPTIAWIIFALSVYTAIQLLGHLKSLRFRFTAISEDILTLRYGLFGDAEISLQNIERIEQKENLEEIQKKELVRMSLLGELEPFNTVIYLYEPVTVRRPYGLRKSGKLIALWVDQVEDLRKWI